MQKNAVLIKYRLVRFRAHLGKKATCIEAKKDFLAVARHFRQIMSSEVHWGY